MADNTRSDIQLIDLGLPSGTLWAACNVGATSPEQAGLYFAWGEISGFAADEEGELERVFFGKAIKEKKYLMTLLLSRMQHTHVWVEIGACRQKTSFKSCLITVT